MNSIVAAESPLRRLPSNLPPRDRVLLDGIRFSAEMYGLAFERLLASLAKIAQDKTSAGVTGGLAAPFSDAWTMIDTVNRMRPLLKALPGGTRSAVIEDFLAATQSVYTLRNRVQHLHGRVDKMAADKLPTWGTITWLSAMGSPPQFKTHALLPGATFDAGHALENPAGVSIRPPLDQVKLRAHGVVVVLTDLPPAVHQTISFLEVQITGQFRDIPTIGSDMYIEAEFVPNDDADTQPG